ncbi:restriction endonuclease subunit S [Clostridium perfringens]|nr:restriction endonuclease subunit S [Clostridium perfringens]
MKKEVREGYKMTELGKIPNEWQIKNLEEILVLGPQNGIYKHKNFYNGSKNYIIQLGDFYSCNKYLRFNNLSGIELNNNEIELYKLNAGDLIINRVSKAIDGVGRIKIVLNCDKVIVYESNLIRASLNKQEVIPEFIYYVSEGTVFRGLIMKMAKVSNQTSISQHDIKLIKIALPTISEQKKIISILSTVDEQIENTEKLIQKNQELKKGLMQQLLTKGIGHTEFKKTELGIIPKKWRLKKIDEIGKVITGNTPKTTEKDNYGDEFLWVSPFDMGSSKYIKNTNKMLSKKGFDKARKLPSGAVLVTCIGSTIGKIGIATNELSTNQQINSIICNEDVDSEFIYYAIDYNFSKYSNYISNQAVPIINKSTFGEFLIQIPELKEQNKVAKILSKVDDNIEKQLNKKKKLEILRNGLMQQLLTGNIRVI